MSAKDIENGKLGGRPVEWTDERIQEEADALLEWFGGDPFGAKLWLRDFAIERGYPAENLSRWAAGHDGFSQALKRAKDIQESRLVQAGLRSQLNPALVIFSLKNHHDWRDKSEVEHGGELKTAGTVRIFDDAQRHDYILAVREAAISATAAGATAVGTVRDNGNGNGNGEDE